MLRYMAGTVLLVLLLASTPALAFQGKGCAGDCRDCHSLTRKEADELLKTRKFNAQVTDIRTSPVKGLWAVEIMQGDQRFKVFIDYGKKYLVQGRISFVPLADIGKPPKLRKVDTQKIPLDDAIVVGDRNAANRFIVFDDPDCPYCAKFHKEIKKIVKERNDIAFFIKLYPLPTHPEAYGKSKAIVCAKSVKLLEDAFAGKKLPPAECDTEAVDDNIRLAKELGIRGTPAVIFPDGRLFPGYLDAKDLLQLLEMKEE